MKIPLLSIIVMLILTLPLGCGNGSAESGVQSDVEAAEQLPANDLRDWVIQNYQERLPAWRKAAQDGHAGAKWLLGACYAIGCAGETGSLPPSLWPSDVDMATKWWGESAVQGFPPAQFQLGLLSLSQDQAIAADFLLMASSQGHKEATELLHQLPAQVVFDAEDRRREMADMVNRSRAQSNP